MKDVDKNRSEPYPDLVVFFPLMLVGSTLFNDLALVEEVDRKHHMGVAEIVAARVPPYNVCGISFQYFDRIELALNYRIYTGMLDKTFGHEGFIDKTGMKYGVKFILKIVRNQSFIEVLFI